MMYRSAWISSLCAVALAAVASSGCSNAPPERPTIRLSQSPWLGSEINVAVARQLLENQLGYTVEVRPESEQDGFTSTAAGESHAILEVWSSVWPDEVRRHVETDMTLERGGDLGVRGHIGWFIPTYLLTDHPELATWEGFTTPETATLFATTGTAPHGRFVEGDPTWGHYEAQIFENLGIDFEVEYMGTEAALVAEVRRAYEAGEPIVFYMWTPHSIFAALDLTEVQLPPYSDECAARAESGGVDCGYISEPLIKLFWPGLRELAPDAHTLLSNFRLSNADQIEMLGSVELLGNSVDAAAREWIAENPTTWRPWLP